MTNVISQWAWLPQTFYGGKLFQEKIIYLSLFLRVLFSRNIFLALKKLPTQTVNENFREWKHWYTYLYTYTFIQIQNTHTRVFCLIFSSRFHFFFFKWTIHFFIVILIHEDNRPQMQHKKYPLWEREREIDTMISTFTRAHKTSNALSETGYLDMIWRYLGAYNVLSKSCYKTTIVSLSENCNFLHVPLGGLLHEQCKLFSYIF